MSSFDAEAQSAVGLYFLTISSNYIPVVLLSTRIYCSSNLFYKCYNVASTAYHLICLTRFSYQTRRSHKGLRSHPCWTRGVGLRYRRPKGSLSTSSRSLERSGAPSLLLLLLFAGGISEEIVLSWACIFTEDMRPTERLSSSDLFDGPIDSLKSLAKLKEGGSICFGQRTRPRPRPALPLRRNGTGG